jgi:hypothetical protein
MANDEQNLKLLSIFHYVVGGIMALFSCFPIIHAAAPIRYSGRSRHTMLRIYAFR